MEKKGKSSIMGKRNQPIKLNSMSYITVAVVITISESPMNFMLVFFEFEMDIRNHQSLIRMKRHEQIILTNVKSIRLFFKQ